MTDISLRITEIFYSLQGEACDSGYPTVFVRLTGCPLRCSYCDSEYAFHGGERLSLASILATVKSYGARKVCVTGGEPLAQADCVHLLSALCDAGYDVSIETSGALDISDIDKRVSIVMDIKTPASGEVSRNRWENIAILSQKDQIKFVICNREDFDWASFKYNEFSLSERVSNVLMSSSFEQLEPATLAQWILDEKLNVRFQMQVHKLLWGDQPGV